MLSNLSPDSFNGSPILIEPEYVMLKNGPVANYAVVIEDGIFTDVGPSMEVAARYPHLKRVAIDRMVLMPGFIDAHHHLTQSFGKALAFGEPSEIFQRVWIPLEGNLDEELMYLSSKLAVLESLRGGFTTVVDAGTRAEGGLEPLAKAVNEVGVRCVLGMICNDNGGTSPNDPSKILQRANHHLARWENSNILHPSLAISIPEAATDNMLYQVASLCKEAEVVFQTHANEHVAAVERSLIQRGLRPIEHLNRVGALGQQTLLAHSTLITPQELTILQRTNTAVAYNPVASQWKGNGVAPALMMYELGIRLGLGTDGTRSDAFRLIDAAEATQRLAFGLASIDFSTGGGWPWLDLATKNGAEAILLNEVTGEIAKGKAADFLLVDIDVPELLPSRDLVWELTRLGNRDQIIGVFVAGDLRLWRGWPIDWDARALMEEVATKMNKAVENAPIHKIHPTSMEHRENYQN